MSGPFASDEQIDPFRSPGQFLADLDPETTGHVVACATDVALIVEAGVIRDVAVGSGALGREGDPQSWRDRPWIDTVTVESRPKVEHLIRDASTTQVRWRQVNHPSRAGADVPVRYATVRTGPDRVVALGRDLRTSAQLQQRLVEAHQRLERDYTRLRDAEGRYELLFHAVSEPVMIVDPDGPRVLEANPAAAHALGTSVGSVTGTSLDRFFSPESRAGIARLVAQAASTGGASASALHTEQGHECDVAASAFRNETGVRLIVRLESEAAPDPVHLDTSRRDFLTVVEALPDGLVVAGADQRIVAANRAFAEMARLVSQDQLVGGRLSEFLGRSPTETNALVSSLQNHGVVRNFATVLRDRFGNEEEVEVSAVTAPGHPDGLYGFSVRNVARRLSSGIRVRDGLPNSPDQLAGFVGRVPLKEIVRDATDFIEKLCIEAALEITDDNRASAAEMLGLSRQSLYSKLKRFGLEEPR